MSETPATLGEGLTGVLRLDDQFCFAVYAASRAITRAYRPALEALGLTYPQYLVLMVLWESHEAGEEPTVNALGDRLHLDSGTLTPLLRRMESRGLLERRVDPDDERRRRVALTDEGAALEARAVSVPLSLLCHADGVDPARIFAIRDELRELLDRLPKP